MIFPVREEVRVKNQNDFEIKNDLKNKIS